MNNYRGDLADIVIRASEGVMLGSTTTTTTTTTTTHEYPLLGSSSDTEFQFSDIYWGHPDIILGEVNAISIPTSTTFLNTGVEESTKAPASVLTNNNRYNFFSSNMVQVSEDTSSNNIVVSNTSNYNNNNNNKVVKPAGHGMSSISDAGCSSTKGGGLVEGATGVQISSPRNQGTKKRKIQAKKVICIPAPAATSNRQTGEVVPSDLWAWRKYGQKPIKGSPYPRGYYRCSSSKGCSARKQVERSRTDPKLLVITYTSEHNHPWPIKRNALAGSTKPAQLASKSSPKMLPQAASCENHSNNYNNVLVKEEDHSASKTTTTTLCRDINDRANTNTVICQNNSNMPKPVTYNGQQQAASHDFFEDFVEYESGGPLNLLGTQGCKALDSFGGLFDWPTNNTNSSTTNEQDNDLTMVSPQYET